MVKKILFLLVFFLSLQANDKELLHQKIKEIVSLDSYEQNKAYIGIVFSPEDNFVKNGRVDIIKIVKTLKDNGLLDLFFDKPTEIELVFKTNGTPLFFVKILEDTLRNIGYYRFVTKSASYNNSEFNWDVGVVSEYATDPIILQKELAKSNCKIVDIKRETPTKWIYTIDISNASMDVKKLNNQEEVSLKRSLSPYWLNISKIRKLHVISRGRNNWYPDISFFDAMLHLVKVIQIDKKTKNLNLKMPKTAKYIKISDIYTMKNIKDRLVLKPSGVR